MSRMMINGRALARIGLLVSLVGLILIWAYPRRHDLQDTLSYSTRPLWDTTGKAEAPNHIIPHLQADGVAADDAAACARHGWVTREHDVKLVDAFLISTEVELLEARLRELEDVVDKFVIVESDYTLMGQPKNMTFQQNWPRWSKWSSKIVYQAYKGRAMNAGDGPFTLVNEMRLGVSNLLRGMSLSAADLVLMSDIDEIPSRSALQLLKACQAPSPIHLQLRPYTYSFEWEAGEASWRASLHQWGASGNFYGHGKRSDVMLADAGWHCSWCFATLEEFVQKMKGASHADRLYHRLHWQQYLSHERIQSKICKGEDLFDMLPETYSWSELIEHWRGSTRTPSAVGLPRAVIQDAEKFKFLLPGGCKRQAR
ncbi:glycosyltransferase family 17 protein [Ceraceosorus bombacis]|uniref:Glycosyltransferase family 17 protein n=1 Tax=Ceraceosorus bombacis TaxID=401625 RepID=A0A0P1BCQ9_9BASI|nr:glycosyltransferase family 17 protein [Ceraceosorus bombacis]